MLVGTFGLPFFISRLALPVVREEEAADDVWYTPWPTK